MKTCFSHVCVYVSCSAGEEKEDSARDQDLGKSSQWNKCHRAAGYCTRTSGRLLSVFTDYVIQISIPWAVRLSWLENVYCHPLFAVGNFDA